MWETLSPNGGSFRIFCTCWIVFAIHFSPNIVREIYPALALGDHATFRVDEYAHLHPDLFEKPGYGWHIGNNPGASMLAAIPYALARPLIDPIVRHVKQKRSEADASEPPAYNSPWPMAREFYAEAWRRGLDIKFGLGALVMQLFCMAPASAASAVLMFHLLRHVLRSGKQALWLTLLYAFGTPVFFRTGFLNQNLLLGQIAFAGFLYAWNPWRHERPSEIVRYIVAGVAGGMSVLFDYSGIVLLLCLFIYCAVNSCNCHGPRSAIKYSASYILGSIPPISLLWFYQWKSFGHPFFPGQHWMPPVEWIELGYRGYGPPQLELLWALAFDYRFGLFVTCPLFLLGIFCCLHGPTRRTLPRLELATMMAVVTAMWVFFSGSNYTRLQFNTGIRYMAPVFPFLFMPAAVYLARLPRWAVFVISVPSVTLSWCLAMHRNVETGPGILNPVLHVFLDGFELPLLTSLSRMETFQSFFSDGGSPLAVFALTAVVVAGIWMIRPRSIRPTMYQPTIAQPASSL